MKNIRFEIEIKIEITKLRLLIFQIDNQDVKKTIVNKHYEEQESKEKEFKILKKDVSSELQS